MPIDDATWEQVHAAYVASKLSVGKILAKFAITEAQFYKRRRDENWPLRQPDFRARMTRPKTLPDADHPNPQVTAAGKPASHAASSRAARAALILRLYNAIDLKLTQMEQRMSDPEATRQTSSADHEREARTLTGLVRNFERVTEMDADLTKPAGKSAAAKSSRPGTAAPADGTGPSGPAPLTTAAALAADPARAMLLRRDIAQRLERIMAKGNPPGDAG